MQFENGLIGITDSDLFLFVEFVALEFDHVNVIFCCYIKVVYECFNFFQTQSCSFKFVSLDFLTDPPYQIRL